MTTFNSSCSEEFLHRLRSRFKDGRLRSSWIVKTLSTELDRLDGIDIENRLHDSIVRDIVPQVRKLLKMKDHTEILELWSGSQEMRTELSSQLSMRVTDDDLKRALSEVLKEYE